MSAGTVARKADGAGIESFAHLALANIAVAVAAFGVASAMAIMQALSRANLDLPFRSPGLYYMSVTAHGTLMALGFTSFHHGSVGRRSALDGTARRCAAQHGYRSGSRSWVPSRRLLSFWPGKPQSCTRSTRH